MGRACNVGIQKTRREKLKFSLEFSTKRKKGKFLWAKMEKIESRNENEGNRGPGKNERGREQGRRDYRTKADKFEGKGTNLREENR
jgi:hypothetical protein